MTAAFAPHSEQAAEPATGPAARTRAEREALKLEKRL